MYAVVIEKGPTSYGAYVPDLPGCFAVGETREEVCDLIREAIELYVEALKEDGQPLPEPQAYRSVRVAGAPCGWRDSVAARWPMPERLGN